MNEFKWLGIDTEWSYVIGYYFPSKKPQFMPARNIKFGQFCTNASYKWGHEVNVHSVSILDDMKQFRLDRRNKKKDNFKGFNYKIVMEKLHKAMSEADIIFCHNEEFDIKMLNVGFRKYGLGQISEKKIICTLKAARKYFRFAGNGLDDLLKEFGHEGKAEKPDWIKLTEGCESEIRKSIPYCDRDVVGGEIVLKELMPFMRNLPRIRDNSTKFFGVMCCEACGSKRLHNKGLGGLAPKIYPRVRCMECGHEHKGNIKIWRSTHK